MADGDEVTPKKYIRVLVIGASGTGKSALINSLVGAEVAQEGSETLSAQTRQVTLYEAKYTRKKPELQFMYLWDSPGLEEIEHASMCLEEVLMEIQEKIREVDVILFCTNMTSARFRQGDNQNVKIVTKVFGDSIWKHTIVVLTFANHVKPPPTRKGTPPTEYFEERLLEWKGQIQSALERVGVSNEVADSVAILPAGYHDEFTLPGRTNWLDDLCHSLQVAGGCNTQPLVLNLNLEKLRTEIKMAASKPIQEHPTALSAKPKTRNMFAAVVKLVCGLAVAGCILGGRGSVIAGGVVCGLALLYCCYRYIARKE